jgi:hypothetical protein
VEDELVRTLRAVAEELGSLRIALRSNSEKRRYDRHFRKILLKILRVPPIQQRRRRARIYPDLFAPRKTLLPEPDPLGRWAGITLFAVISVLAIGYFVDLGPVTTPMPLSKRSRWSGFCCSFR